MVKLEQKLQDMGGILRDFLSQVQGNNHLNFPISGLLPSINNTHRRCNKITQLRTQPAYLQIPLIENWHKGGIRSIG